MCEARLMSGQAIREDLTHTLRGWTWESRPSCSHGLSGGVAGRLGRSFTYSAQLQRLVLPEGQEARLRQGYKLHERAVYNSRPS